MQTHEMLLSADQIVEETSDWPEDAVTDLVDRILRAKYGEIDPSVDVNSKQGWFRMSQVHHDKFPHLIQTIFKVGASNLLHLILPAK
jgi:hypothetical protein